MKAGEARADSLRLQLFAAQEAAAKVAQPRSVVDADGMTFLFTKTLGDLAWRELKEESGDKTFM